MKHILRIINLVLATLFFLVSATVSAQSSDPIQLVQKIQPPNPSIKNFGMSVDFAEEHMVVTDGLFIYFYQLTKEGTWKHLHSHSPEQTKWQENDLKNAQVSVSKDVAYLGLPNADVIHNGKNVKNAGAVYVYRYRPNNGGWMETAKITSPKPVENGYFGEIDAWGYSCLISSPGAGAKGKSYLFVLNDHDKWERITPENDERKPYDLPNGDKVMCTEDASIVIDDTKSKDGTSYQFIHMLDIAPGGHWRTRYFNSPKQERRWNGSVSMHGLHMVVAGHEEQSNTIDFYHYADDWSHQQTEQIESGNPSNYSVQVVGNIALLTAPNSSTIRFYEYDVYQKGGRWMPLQDLSADKNVQFGYSVAIEGNTFSNYEATILISAYSEENGYVSYYKLKK